MNKDLLSMPIRLLGVPADQARLVTAILLGVPLAMVLRSFNNSQVLAKHRFSYIVGLLTMFYMYDASEVLVAVAFSLFVYFSLKYVPQKFRWVIVISMVFLIVIHARRMIVDFMGWSMDFSTTQMLLTVKYMSFAFNVHDGLSDYKKLSPWALEHMIIPGKFPSIEEFLGHIFFFPGILSGPVFEYSDYLSFVNMEKFKQCKPANKVPYNLKKMCNCVFQCASLFGSHFGLCL